MLDSSVVVYFRFLFLLSFLQTLPLFLAISFYGKKPLSAREISIPDADNLCVVILPEFVASSRASSISYVHRGAAGRD